MSARVIAMSCTLLAAACSATVTEAPHEPRGGRVRIVSLTVPPPTEGQRLTMNVASDRGEDFELSSSTFMGGWTTGAWGFTAYLSPAQRVLAVAIAGPVESKVNQVGTEQSGTHARFVDAMTYSRDEALFVSTSGTLTVTEVEMTGPAGAETVIVSGAFDIQLSNEGATQASPAAVLQVFGTFNDIVIPPW
jgi:hypothetical protein